MPWPPSDQQQPVGAMMMARRSRLAQSPIAAVAAGKRRDGSIEMRFSEFRPADVSDPQFRVADLPEQKVADPHFARRANEEVGVGHAPCVEPHRNRLLVDLRRIEQAIADLLRQRPRGIDDLGPRTVVDRQTEPEAVVVGAEFNRTIELAKRRGGQTLTAADHRQTDAFTHQE